MAHRERRGGGEERKRERYIYAKRKKECLLVSFRKKNPKKRTIFSSLLFSPLRFPLSLSLSKLDEMKRWQTEYICVRHRVYSILIFLVVCVCCAWLYFLFKTRTLHPDRRRKICIGLIQVLTGCWCIFKEEKTPSTEVMEEEKGEKLVDEDR